MAPDLMQFAQELMQQQKAAEATNTWDPFISALDPIQTILVKNAASGNAKLGELAFGSLLTGMLGGGLNILKDKEQAQTNQQISEIMQSAALGKPVEKPSGMSDTLYQNAVTKGQTYAAQKALERQNELQKLSDQFSLFKQQELFKDPYLAKRINSVLGQGSGGSVFSGGEVTKEPSSTKPFQSYLDQTDGDKAAAEKLFEKDLNKPKENFEQLSSLRKEFEASKTYQNMEVASKAFPTFMKALRDKDNPAADFEIAKGAVQIIEPGMSVNSGEAQAVAASSTIPGSMKSAIVSALTTGSKLPPEIREGLKDLALRHFEGHRNLFETQRSSIEGDALKYGLISQGQHVDRLGNLSELIGEKEILKNLILDEAAKQEISGDLILKLVEKESGFNPKAKGAKGEIGLFQLMPETAKGLGVDPSEVMQNIRGGIKYLKMQSQKYGGDLEKALAAYNAGPGRVDSGTIPDSTKSYVSDILGKKEAPQMDEALMAQLMQFKTLLDQNGLVFQNGQFFKRK